MQSKEQFETSQLIEYKDYENKSINNIRDILALESESGAEGGQRPRNTLPGAWDVIREYAFLISLLNMISGLANPIWLRDLESSVNVYNKLISQLDRGDSDEWKKIKKYEKIVKKLKQRIEKYGKYHIIDGQHRCTFIWETLHDLSKRCMPITPTNDRIWYKNSEGKTKSASFSGADNKALKFSMIDDDAKDFILNLPIKVTVVKNLTEENANEFFKTVNENYRMTMFLLQCTSSISDTKDFSEELISNPAIFNNDEKNGLFDRLTGKSIANKENSYEEEYMGEYRLVCEMIALYKYHKKEYRQFDYDYDKIASTLNTSFDLDKSIKKKVKSNLLAIADATLNHADYKKISRPQLYDVMSVLLAMESKSHPVRKLEGLWDDDLEIKNQSSKKAIVIEILNTINLLKDEDKYIHDNGKFETVKTEINARSKPSKTEYWTWYINKDNERVNTKHKEKKIGTKHYGKVVVNEHSYHAHTKDQKNIHEREIMILTRLEQKIKEFVQKGYLIDSRQSTNRNAFVKSIVRNSRTLHGKKIKSIKGANVSDGHKDPRSKSGDESLDNAKPESLEYNQKKGVRNLSI